jgi:hypothetical protein
MSRQTQRFPWEVDSPSDHPTEFGLSRARFPQQFMLSNGVLVSLFCVWDCPSRAVPMRKLTRQPTRISGVIPWTETRKQAARSSQLTSFAIEALLTLPDSTSIPPTASGRIGRVSGGVLTQDLLYRTRHHFPNLFPRHKQDELVSAEKTLPPQIESACRDECPITQTPKTPEARHRVHLSSTYGSGRLFGYRVQYRGK